MTEKEQTVIEELQADITYFQNVGFVHLADKFRTDVKIIAAQINGYGFFKFFIHGGFFPFLFYNICDFYIIVNYFYLFFLIF